ncbi:MAG: DUF6468 domain-containing protein [Caulobacteraceae bacterium]
MSPIGFAMDVLLIVLLVSAFGLGLRLNRRLKALRDTQAGFAEAAIQLNGAILRAEQGLTAMRRATEDAEVTLTERVDEARAAARKLDEAMMRARSVPVPAVAPAPVRERETIAAFTPPPASVREDAVLDLREPATVAIHPRSRARVDDDLFMDGGDNPRVRAGVR